MMKTGLNRILTMVFWQFAISQFIISQSIGQQASLQERIGVLNERVKQAEERKQYALVETYLGEILITLEEMGAPVEQIRQQAHQKIQYSYSLNRLEQARQAALDWLMREPNDLKTLDLLGTITFRMNRLLEARDAMAKVYQTNPNGPATQRRYLKVLTMLDENETASQLCEQILKTNADDARSLVEVIDSYLYFSQAEPAQAAYDLLEKKGHDQAYLNYSLARIKQEQNEWQPALDLFNQTGEQDPNYTDSLFRSGLCLSELREWENAAKKFMEFLSFIPEDKRVYTQLETALTRLQKQNGAALVRQIRLSLEERFAIADEAQYLARQGDQTEAARLHALLAVKQGLFNRAETILQEAIQYQPESVKPRLHLAEHCLKSLQAHKAEQIYKSLRITAPSSERSVIQSKLFQSQLLQGNTSEIEKAMDELDENNHTRQEYLALLGSYYLEIAGNPEKAIELLNEPRTTIEQARPFYVRAMVEAGKYENMDLEMESILPEHRDPAVKMAFVIILAHVGKIKEARQVMDETLSEHPNLPILTTAKAQAVLVEAETSSPKHEWVEKAHRVSQALPKIRQHVIEIHQSGWKKSIDQLIQLADINEQLGNHIEAVKLLYMAANAQPDEQSIHQKLIECLDQPIDAIERLYQIRLYKQKYKSDDFAIASNEVYTLFELN